MLGGLGWGAAAEAGEALSSLSLALGSLCRDWAFAVVSLCRGQSKHACLFDSASLQVDGWINGTTMMRSGLPPDTQNSQHLFP